MAPAGSYDVNELLVCSDCLLNWTWQVWTKKIQSLVVVFPYCEGLDHEILARKNFQKLTVEIDKLWHGWSQKFSPPEQAIFDQKRPIIFRHKRGEKGQS